MTLLDELASSVERMDPEEAMALSKRAVDAGIDPTDTVENGIAKGLRRVGERFERGEAFLTGLVGAAAASKEAPEKVLRPDGRGSNDSAISREDRLGNRGRQPRSIRY